MTRPKKLNRDALTVDLPDRISADWLRGLGACSEAVAIFRKRWPKGAPVKPETVIRAVNLGLDMNWLALRILTDITFRQYREAEKPALRAYYDAMFTATAFSSWKAYREAKAPASKAYREATVKALANILWK